ncbi:phosphate ABC transporter ATP-binding protein PstB [Prosthecobacter sp.]|uniref:phosphate ABC transporter ATP-binding protein PstB n=1 Tax=Prosthecobacter sp. TaxID=1965333 RepID=UPI002AB994DD|nr:phosphate ABC transporter ATP-binding protein PstB [Prosthecobacter sp.]MDZ4402206.1 phosphate ABC transporter ATP-binding protein PstB [Prosthecobacter sp.]
MAAATPAPSTEEPLIQVEKFNYAYGDHQVLFDVDLNMHSKDVMALIGPSGCGKSTLIRSINRINDLVESARVVSGSIKIDGVDLYAPNVDVINLRRNVGMVFQKYNPFPRSIFENAVYGLRVAGIKDRHDLEEAAERSLKSAALWDEVKDRLHEMATGLSGGQQQRLCIARAIALQPRILLMDEPCAALDPIATARIEELILQLRGQYTFVIVTHNMEQAKRIADRTAFFYKGKLIEEDDTMTIFHHPNDPLTEAYITGRLT